MSIRHKRAALSRKQAKFIDEYAHLGNGTEAAAKAGYRGDRNTLGVVAHQNLRKHKIAAALSAKLAEITATVTPDRVQNRLNALSFAAQDAGQFGPAVRAEELLGKSIGMWIDQQLSVVVGDTAVAAMIALAHKRRDEPIDLTDDAKVETSDG